MRASIATLLLAVCACRAASEADPLVERARFGVFFGGQIQDRKELPFELDEAKQRVGMRIDFRTKLTHPARITWEIARPLSARASKADAGAEQVVEVGEATARAGESELDIPISLRQGQVLGVWHVTVKVEGHSVIDRDVNVFDPRERRESDSKSSR